MTNQIEKLEQWSESTGIKLENFYSIEFWADHVKLYGKFNNEITRELFNLQFECHLMATGSIKLFNNNINIYLS